ncbi:MAG: PHP domain-containing protein [Clostridia bacterium]
MKLFYDLHIHTALSPCGSDDSTPNNVVNMATLMGLDVIAITDHNSCGNARACVEVGEKAGILVIPGMELTTSEEIHVVCLFETVEDAESFSAYVENVRMKIKNKTNIFGNQIYFDSGDNVVGEEQNLLIVSSNIDIYDVAGLVKEYNGVAFLSHINREGSGAVAMLGGISHDMGFKTVEFTKYPNDKYLADNNILGQYRVLTNSDAHNIEDIMDIESFPNNFLEVKEKSIRAVLDFIDGK